jgi:nitrilase
MRELHVRQMKRIECHPFIVHDRFRSCARATASRAMHANVRIAGACDIVAIRHRMWTDPARPSRALANGRHYTRDFTVTQPDMNIDDTTLRVALAQIAPVWLDRDATVLKIVAAIDDAALQGAKLVVFGEALLPGYPFWIEHTDGARFEDDLQKSMYAHYCTQAVSVARGDLEPIREAARRHGLWVALGTIERADDRGGHSLYCSLMLIDDAGELRNVHRKLMPTYEERLVWSPGDGAGLRTFPIGPFTVGALNCWENWMPLPRAALSAQGEDLHLAVWPGSRRNTEDITRFAAREGRSYVVSVGAPWRREDIPDSHPHAALLRARMNGIDHER